MRSRVPVKGRYDGHRGFDVPTNGRNRRENPKDDVAYTMKPATKRARLLLEARRKIIESGQRLLSVDEILRDREAFRAGKS